MKCQIQLSPDHVFVITKGLISSQFTTVIHSSPLLIVFFILIETHFIRLTISSAHSEFRP